MPNVRTQKGHPCLTPLESGISSINLPLTWTFDTTFTRRAYTSLRKVPPSPIFSKIAHMYLCSTLSNAFSKSRRIRKMGILFLVAHSTTINANDMFSRMDRLGMNPICCGLISVLPIGLSLVERRKANNLYMIVSIVSGL